MSAQSEQDDNTLVAAARDGDQRAFGALMDRHQRYLLMVADSFLHNTADAEDLMQDVWSEVWRKLGMFNPDKATLRTWLVTITRNRSMDRMGVFSRYSQRLERFGALQTVEMAGPETGELSEFVSMIEKHARFTDVELQAWHCTYILGMSNAEAAGHLGIPVGTYSEHLRRCRRRVTIIRQDLETPQSCIGLRLPKANTTKVSKHPTPYTAYDSRGYWKAFVRSGYGKSAKYKYVGRADSQEQAHAKAIDALPRLTDNA